MYDSGVSTLYTISCRPIDYINHCQVLDTAALYTFRHLTSVLPSGVWGSVMSKLSTGKVYRNIAKVKFTPEQTTKAQRGSSGIALLFL